VAFEREADVVSLLHAVDVPRRPVSMLEPVIGAQRYEQVIRGADQLRPALAGHTIWNVNSTAAGGGVAEMLQVLVGYVQDLDIPIGWLVIGGDAEFFATTKRLHNQIHGHLGGGPLTAADADHYAQLMDANAVELLARVQPGDVVLLHDPQTAGLAAPLARAGARVVWRCHIGVDGENDVTRAAWEFLRPHLTAAEAYVFSRGEYVPPWMPAAKVWIIPPSIDPFSPKNQQLDAETVRGILAQLGVLDAPAPGFPPRFTRRDGTVGTVTRSAVITGEGRPGPGDPVLMQVSRWDRLKDMGGVMRAFADYVASSDEGYLMLVGPSVKDVSDDPEGAAVYGECLLQWRALNPAARARVLLVTLPLDDIDENAVMVNALQRHAAVIAQKSLAEGFGLTVSEGMWKGRPVIGSLVGGIIDQIGEGTGILLPDPADLRAFGEAACFLLGNADQATRMGGAAHAYVRERFLGDVHLLHYARLVGTLIAGDLAPRPAGLAADRRLTAASARGWGRPRCGWP
jgi:trehalose synthase